MDFGDFELRFSWLTTLSVLTLVTLFVALGLWQLHRAEEKRALAAQLGSRAQMPAVVLDHPVRDAEALRFRKLAAVGTYEPDGQIYLENRRHGQRSGFHVITPLRLAGSDLRVLVNRGWVPASGRGEPTEAPVPVGEVRVEGETHIPAPPALALHGHPGAAAAWGERWPYLTLDLYRATVDYPLQPVVILLDPGAEGGFVRSWPRELPKEGMHIGYALQWFAFAVIALAIWLRLSLQRRRRDAPAS